MVNKINFTRFIPLLLTVLVLAGCATIVQYQPYTSQQFAPKSKYYFVTIYPATQQPPAGQMYTVIGKVHISGHVSDGVTPQTLMDQAKVIARKKGADAIINVKTQNFTYNGTYVVPPSVSYRPVLVGGWHHDEVVYVEHYHPAGYVPYSDTVLDFDGELMVFTPNSSKESVK